MPFEVAHKTTLPEGVFLRAELSELEVKEIPYTDKKTGEAKSFTKLAWKWRITEGGEFLGMVVFSDTNADLNDSPHCVFRNWAEALLQRPLDLGQVLNETDLIGLSALVTVKHEPSYKDPNVKYARIEDVIPLDPSESFSAEPPF